MRSFSQLSGGSPVAGIPGIVAAGIRAQPTVQPVPNNVPVGAQTGAPPRTRMYSRLILPGQRTLLVDASPENRVVSIQPPNVKATLYVGDPGLTVGTGMAISAGGQEIPIVGLQEVWAVTDSPTAMRVNVYVSIVLMAEQARPVGQIENEPAWGSHR